MEQKHIGEMTFKGEHTIIIIDSTILDILQPSIKGREAPLQYYILD